MRFKHSLIPGQRYQIRHDKKVIKFFQKHPDIFERIQAKEPFLELGDFSVLDIKRLKHLKEKYRLRVGKYRFLFAVESNQLLIYFYDADSRGGVY